MPQTSQIEFDAGRIRIAIHGGAGDMPERDHGYAEQRASLHAIVRNTRQRLVDGASALDAAQFAVEQLENDALFNAGCGAVLNSDGAAEMDAALMAGDRRAGAVAGVQRPRNPVQLARALLDDGTHVLLAGAAADALAARLDITVEPPSYFVTELRSKQLARARSSGQVMLDHDEQVGTRDAAQDAARPAVHDEDGVGTVGAVVRDGYGRLAAGTSTGGMTNKHPGRVGDSPLIGAGTWADDATCAVSCTGHGEAFIRANVAGQVHWQMALAGLALDAAATAALADAQRLGGTGGLIAIDADGRLHLPYSTRGMFRGWCDADGEIRAAVFAD